MTKTDITKNNLYIKRMINVIKSENPEHHKIIHINGRHSDAFVYILSGSCEYTFDDNAITANAGDILYLAYNSVYSMYINTTDYKFIFCDFEFDGDAQRESCVYSSKNMPGTENLFLRMYNASKKRHFTECMSILYRIYSAICVSVENTYIGKSVKYKISTAKEYIDANASDALISVAEIANKIGMCEGYFRKLFKSQYGISPSQYIISTRLKKAKDLMNYPFLTLSECALQSGFSSLQYFCRMFKKNTGITPAQYRKLNHTDLY